MKHSDDLQDLRHRIDSINEKIVALLNQRAAVAIQIGKAKKGGPVYDPVREAEVLAHIAAHNPGPLSTMALEAVFKEIIAVCRAIQQPLRIAYLGPEGTYCRQAALKYYGAGNEYIPCATIEDTLHTAETGNADVAVVPVENSSEGSVNRTLDLLLQTPLVIIGETYLPIHHQLLSHASSLAAITEVTAHPQALAQCQKWLDIHVPTIRHTPATSNGAAAQTAAQQHTVAAIASVQAAELYALPVLARNIEDTSDNTTRFLTLGGTLPPPTGNDKTSLICSTPNRPGALHDLLGMVAEKNINIVKLESRPANSAPWHYIFYIDIEGHQADPQVASALGHLRAGSIFFKVLGSYPQGAA